MPTGRRPNELRRTAEHVLELFPDVVLPFDTEAAAQYGTLVASRSGTGKTMQIFDAQIAAICLARSATLATRNGKDFAGTGVEVIDPWAT
jgi:toxin FitB